MAEEEERNLFNTPSTMQEANDLAARQSAPLRNQPETLEYILRPQALRDSSYHAYLSKNLAITNLSPGDLSIVMLFEEVINLSIYMQGKDWVTADIPQECAATFDTWINGKRAEGMRTFTAISEQTLNLKRSEEQRPSMVGKFKG